jgi:ParB family chromosome partitioning protein
MTARSRTTAVVAAAVSKMAMPSSYIGQVVSIPVNRVKPLPAQPRVHFDAGALERLSNSIWDIGQQQPATVIPFEDGTFRLRDGERRWRCCVNLGIPLIALVVEARDREEEFELSTAANLNREGHSPLEKALAMKRLRDGSLRRKVPTIARIFGITEQAVYNHLKVVDCLPPAILDLMDPNKQEGRSHTLPLTAALRLTALAEYPRQQLRFAKRIVEESLTIAQATRLIDSFGDAKQIQTGVGRERKPSDYLSVLRSTLQRLQPTLNYFSARSQVQINELFTFIDRDRQRELSGELQAAVDALLVLLEKVDAAADAAGSRRGHGKKGVVLVAGGQVAR